MRVITPPHPVRPQSKALITALLLAAGASTALAQPSTTRVSINDGEEGNARSYQPAISPNGNRVIFTTEATNWRPPGNIQYIANAFEDVYLWEGGSTVRIVSARAEPAPPPHSARYTEGNGHSRLGAVSDGYFVFGTDADNLIPVDPVFGNCEDLNGDTDIYHTAFDLALVESVDTDAGEPCGLPGDGDSDDPALSPGGLWIAFESDATTFANDTNGVSDIYITTAGAADTTSRVSIQTGQGYLTPREPNAACSNPVVSEDGLYVVFQTADDNMFAADGNGLADVYRKYRGPDAVFATVTGVSRNIATGAFGNGASSEASMSADGSIVAFTSSATNLGPTDTNGFSDIYVRNYNSDEIILVSVSSFGQQANGTSGSPAVSGDGRFVAFRSFATNLIGNDTNGEGDIFVRDLVGGATFRVSVGDNNAQPNGPSSAPAINDDGTAIVFASNATNLVIGDTNGDGDVFLRTINLPPPNDTCATAAPIALAGIESGSIVGATTQVSVSCAPSSFDVWYVFTATCSGPVSISTDGSDFDTVLSVHASCGGAELACDDDSGPGATSLIEGFEVVDGEDYYIRVAGFSINSGNYVLDVEPVVPANDNCPDAELVGPGVTEFSNCSATNSAPAQACGGGNIGNDLWFRYIPAESGMTRVETCGSPLDTRLAVYFAICPAAANAAFACNDDACGDASALEFHALAGVPYLIRVGSSSEGYGLLRIIPGFCAADWDGDGIVNSNDYFSFLDDYFNGDADFNDDGVTNSDDYFAFLDAYFGEC